MPDDFDSVFSVLKGVLLPFSNRLAVKRETPAEYLLVTRTPSPFPQHKGHPLDIAWIKIGKAYVSFHLVPLYLSPSLTKNMLPTLKKRMQGKACFNFKTRPDPEVLTELGRLVDESLKQWNIPAPQ